MTPCRCGARCEPVASVASPQGGEEVATQVRNSEGLIYFVHQFKPEFIEAALLAEPDMLAAVTELNHQIARLAPVLNSPTIPKAATARSENPTVPIATMLKRHEGTTYLFAVAMRAGTTMAHFAVEGIEGERTVEVLGEERTVMAKAGTFTDRFGPWDVHLYRFSGGGR